MKRELLAVAILLIGAILFPASLFAFQAARTNASDARLIELVGNSPGNGGWSPSVIRVNAGERVRLRISSRDVVHGFENPALGIRVDEILPGHVEQVEFVATQAGRYPFACTRWCSVDHWRMRGVIEVVDAKTAELVPATYAPPLYQTLGIDLDAMHDAEKIPPERPSAARGEKLNLNVRANFRTFSPGDVFLALRGDARNAAFEDQQVWDALAFAYFENAGSDSIATGARLYARDCAACHGERGDGTGPAGKNLPGLTAMHPEMKRGPADFTNAATMMGANDVLLQGKVLRGGMGTGMPEWGSLYAEQEMWDVIAFLRTFTFDFER